MEIIPKKFDTKFTTYMFCDKKCCKLFKSMKIVKEPLEYLLDTSYKTKTGVIILDCDDKVLISQSYNSFWGVPKGSREINETDEEASIRETKEETGINLPKEIFKDSKMHVFIVHKNMYVLFSIKLKSKGPSTAEQPYLLGTESTGCGWINISCLYEMFSSNKIKLNYISKIALERVSGLKWAM